MGSRKGIECHVESREIQCESGKREGNPPGRFYPMFASCLPVVVEILSNVARELSKRLAKYLPTYQYKYWMLGWENFDPVFQPLYRLYVHIRISNVVAWAPDPMFVVESNTACCGFYDFQFRSSERLQALKRLCIQFREHFFSLPLWLQVRELFDGEYKVCNIDTDV